MAYSDPKIVCAPWITIAELCCAGGSDTVDCDGVVTPLAFTWNDDQLIEAASNILFARTCYRFPGICNTVLTFCIECECPDRFYDCGEWKTPIALNIGFPVEDINSVTLNGNALVVDVDYYLDNDETLILRESVILAMSIDNQIVVDLDYGRIPPIELQMAAAELTCELKKACNADTSCSLPPHVTRVVRRDVEYEQFPSLALIQTDFTGNPIIDHAIKIHGNCRKMTAYDALADCKKDFRT